MVSQANLQSIRNYRAGYLQPAFRISTRQHIIDNLERGIRESGEQFDAIVFSGLSGALIAPAVADRLHKPVIAVRKKERRHSYYDVEGFMAGSTYIILDDFIASGKTIRHMVAALLADSCFQHYHPVGIFVCKNLGKALTKTPLLSPQNFFFYPHIDRKFWPRKWKDKASVSSVNFSPKHEEIPLADGWYLFYKA